MSIALGETLRLTYPVVQAPLGACDGPRLAAAVSHAGGLGTLTLHMPSLETTRVRLERLRALTVHPVLLAFTGEWEKEAVLDQCLEMGFRHFQVFWWNGPRLARRIHAGGGEVFWQVGTWGQADEALSQGADGLVVQATEAGGPVRSPHPLVELLPEVRGFAGTTIPLIAGGGLATAADVAQVLTLGANAALLGTRFLLTPEASAPTADKKRLLSAQSSELILDTRLVGEWPCSPRRRLVTARTPDSPSLFAGLGLSEMTNLVSAGTLVRQLSAGL